MTKKSIFNYLLIIIITFVFFLYIKKNLPYLKQVVKIEPSFLFYLVILNIANKFLLGLKIKRIAYVFKIRLSFMAWFGSTVINNFYNYLAPKSGTILAGVYLKNKHGFDYKKYISLLIMSFTITVLTSGIIGTLVSFFAYRKQLISNPLFFVLFGIMVLLPLIVFLVPKLNFPQKGFLNKINEGLAGWYILRKDKLSILILSTLDSGVILLTSLRYFVLFKIFSLDVSLVKCVILAPFNIIIHVSTLVPASYGIKEAAIGLLTKMIGLGFSPGLLATLSDRIVGMSVTFILGPIFSFLLFKQAILPQRSRKQNEE